jgi:hypothetical protein
VARFIALGNVRFSPKADTQNLIIETIPGTIPERLLSTLSGRSLTFGKYVLSCHKTLLLCLIATR